jgi:beta-lactamase class A
MRPLRSPFAPFVLALVAFVAPAMPTQAAAPIPKPPTVDVRAYILIDYATGRVLAGMNEDARMEPASITKVMTAYGVFKAIAEKRLSLDEPALISEQAWRTGGAGSDGSTTYLAIGSTVPVEVLLKGMIVQSGNDASIALAEKVGGTEDAFAQMMNTYAKQLGMGATNFTNSTGLPDPNLYTTARDISTLARAVVRLERHQAAEPQRAAGARSQRRRHQDRPHQHGRLLPAHLGAAQRHAPHQCGVRRQVVQGARRRQRGAAELRLHFLRDRQAARSRRDGAQAARLQGLGRIGGGRAGTRCARDHRPWHGRRV